MTEWQMITFNDKELRKLGAYLFKTHATISDIEDAVRCIDTKYINTKLKKDIIEDLVGNCWNILYKNSDYYNGPIVFYLIKYNCDITKKIEELKEELEDDRNRDDDF